jgi:hypothetical protein
LFGGGLRVRATVGSRSRRSRFWKQLRGLGRFVLDSFKGDIDSRALIDLGMANAAAKTSAARRPNPSFLPWMREVRSDARFPLSSPDADE